MTKAADLSKTGSLVNSSGQIDLTTGVTGILPAANGGTGAANLSSITVGTANTASSVTTTNWTISESGGKLYFAYGGVNKFSLDSSGNFIAVANVTAYGTP